MKFVIFHGSFGSPEGNWFPELKEKLEAFGQEVITHQFPVEDWDKITGAGSAAKTENQNLDRWIATFEKEILPRIKSEEKLCFIGHSIAPVFILHLVDHFNLQLDSAIFVSPFLRALNRKDLWQFDLVNKTFYKTDFDFVKLKKLIPISYVLYSDNDPYVDKKLPLEFANLLQSSTIMVKKAGHLNSEVNLNELPLVLELCKSRLDLSLYQRYLDHRRELFAINYFKGKYEEEIYLKPEEIFDEGMFHFRNLSRKGFCTFFTGMKFWDTQNKYYEEARNAARRVPEFIRVFVVYKLSDLRRPILIKQINLDLRSGIQVYLCMYNEIKNIVPEPDFGIWDNDYLCIVRFKDEKQVEVKLSSRKKDIDEAEIWKKTVLTHSVRIQNIKEDIQKFVSSHT